MGMDHGRAGDRYSRRTVLRPARPVVGPEDAGRLMTLDEFVIAQEEPGHAYELIDGVLIVSPAPQPPHEWWVNCIGGRLDAYARRSPHRINFVSRHAEAVIPGRPGPTRVQPDLAAFRGFSKPPPSDWADVCPLIVVEVISPRREKKDTTRNRQLYWRAGGIAEYWIVDPRDDLNRPALRALVRCAGARGWKEHVVLFGSTYRSATLPRFSLNLRRPGTP